MELMIQVRSVRNKAILHEIVFAETQLRSTTKSTLTLAKRLDSDYILPKTNILLQSIAIPFSRQGFSWFYTSQQ